MTKWLSILQNNDYMAAKQHIKAGGKLNARTESGESVLAYALKSRVDQDLLELLIESGADIFYHDDEGVSILDFAVTYNNMFMVTFLLEKGVSVNNITRKSGFTPLMAAVCYGRYEVFKLLLDAGADIKATERKGMTALDFARKMRKTSMMKRLEEIS